MGLNIDNLPPAMRKQALAKLGADEQARLARRTRATARAAPATDHPWRCGCGEEFVNYRAWERHGGAPGHTRGIMALATQHHDHDHDDDEDDE